ncbi:MAG: Xaa-Pro aminopeptidase, partial [Flavihumibacter sp.]
MHFKLFPRATYTERRRQLAALVPDSLILLMGNEETGMNYHGNVYPFRQDSSFLYYFGLDTPGLAALIDTAKGESVIFGTELSMDDIIWTGPLPGIKEMAAMVGVEKTADYSSLGACLQNKQQSVKFLPPYRAVNRIRIAEWLNIPLQEVAAKASVPLIKAIVSQRAVKDDLEVAAIEEAVSISTDMHLAAMQFARPGMKEYEVAGRMMEVAYGAGGRLSYNIICSKHGHILHNHYQGNTLEKGDLLLIDAGAEQSMHYAGDLTRTFPVGAPFSHLQRSLYNVVHRAIEAASAMLAPGIRYMDIHAKAGEVLLQGLKEMGVVTGDPEEALQQNVHTLFFQCGLGHMMGLDVHDM